MITRYAARYDDDLDEWRVYRDEGDASEPVARCFCRAEAEHIARAMNADAAFDNVKAGWSIAFVPVFMDDLIARPAAHAAASNPHPA